MKKIQKLTGIITSYRDLTPTTREVTVTLSEKLDFIAGSFINVFIDKDGEKLRRAFSISSPEGMTNRISLAIRLKADGEVTPLFWDEHIIGTEVDIMGPLGLNTADKMQSKRIYLFGFGVGAGVMLSLADHFTKRPDIESLIIMTGSRNDNDIVYQQEFISLVESNTKVKVDFVISRPDQNSTYKKGYIQDHLDSFDFNNSDVYVCGQEAACEDLVKKIQSTNPIECHFFVEGFH